MKRPTHTITLEQVQNKCWELANLSTEDTKGSISGQLKALDMLHELLTPVAAAAKPVSIRPEGMYRSAWLDDEPA